MNYCGDSDKDSKSQTSGILPTALMVMYPPLGHTKELRSLFGSGARRTFVTQGAVEECKRKREKPVQLSISGFWDTKEPGEHSTVTVPVRVNDNSLVTLKAVVVPKLPQSTRPHGLCRLVSELKSGNVNLAGPKLAK